MSRKIRLAWVSPYNSRCGLATHSEHLLEHFDRDVYDITVIGNHQELVRPDSANVVRLWPDRSGSLASVRDFIRTFDVLFVNFHFSLMEIYDLAETLEAAQRAGIVTYVTIHKTIDTVIDGRTVSLNEIADILRACTRLIVHTAADIARLKTFGLTDNVVMIPPGVIDRPALSPATVRGLLNLRQFHPIVGTFGFLLPPKGLPQLIRAFALVLRYFPDALLLMLNAVYPGAPESTEERDRSLALIRELGLEDHVKLVDEFLETDEILLLLNAGDLTVFTYQNSDESDSGAVRLGLAAGRPVATTPLPVFANLAGVVHQFSGGAPADIAEGIVALLRDPDGCATIVRQQQDWIGRNSWAAQAARIGKLIRGCFAERHAAGDDRSRLANLILSARSRLQLVLRRQPGGDDKAQLLALAERAAAVLRRAVPTAASIAAPRTSWLGGAEIEWLPAMKIGGAGERSGAGVSAKPGDTGYLVYGPYASLHAGDYRVRVSWSAGPPPQTVPCDQPVATIEAVSSGGGTYLAQRELSVEDCDRPTHDLLFCVDETPAPASPIEVRVWTSGIVPLTVSSITVERIDNFARASWPDSDTMAPPVTESA
jgi:glycosyltransferase involved in cell wall biosynthesis